MHYRPQVLLNKIADSDHTHPDRVLPLLINLTFKLLIFILPLVIICFLFGEELFIYVFGPNWAFAGSLAAPISIVIAIRFVVSPLSAVLTLDRNIKLAAAWQGLYFTSTVIILTVAAQIGFESFIKYFVINELIMYSIYYFLIIKGSLSYKHVN